MLNLFSILCLIKCLQFLQFWFCCLLFLLALTQAALFCVSELIFICGNTWGWDEDKCPERGFAFEFAKSLRTLSTWEHSEINFRLKVLWPTYIGSMSPRFINFHEGRLIVKFSREVFFSSTQHQVWNRQNFLADSFSGTGIILFRSYTKLAGLQRPSFRLRSPIRLPIFNMPRISFLNLALVNTLKLDLRRKKKQTLICNLFQFHIMADFNLPTRSHWTWIWEKICIVSLHKPAPTYHCLFCAWL